MTLPRSKRASTLIILLYLVAVPMLIASVFLHPSDGSHPPAQQALFLAGTSTVALGKVIESWNTQRLTSLVEAGLLLLLGVSGAFSSSPIREQPGWLVILRVTGTVALLTVLGFVMAGWFRERDERERAILSAATALAFVVTLLFVTGFSVSADLSEGIRFTAGWIIAVSVGSWLTSLYVMQRRM